MSLKKMTVLPSSAAGEAQGRLLRQGLTIRISLVDLEVESTQKARGQLHGVITQSLQHGYNICVVVRQE